MALLIALALLVAPIQCYAQGYTLSVDQTNITVGQSITVSWTGSCAPSDDVTGCYDWIAPFIAGTCTGADVVGANTCYAEDQWVWVSDQSSNSWTLQFTAPGVYEFRISYCGCDACNILTSDFAECDSYTSYGTSPTFIVSPPLDLSPYSELEQVAIGFMWYELEQSTGQLQGLLGRHSAACTSSCVCAAESARESVVASYDDFMAVCSSFSMTGVEQCVTDIANAVKALKTVFVDCDLDAVVGQQLTEEIMAALGGMVTGLGDVEAVVKMVMDGESIYTDVANAVEAWNQQDPFATGVNIAKLVNIALAAGDVRQAVHNATMVDPSFLVAQAHSVAQPQQLGMLRHPGGQWSVCKLHSSRGGCRRWNLRQKQL